MRKHVKTLLLFCFYFTICSWQHASLQLKYTITLPNVNGRIDHLSYDSRNEILFVAALGNNTVEVIDLKNKKLLHSIKNLHQPQGIVYIPESNALFVCNGANGQCDIFNAKTFQKINSVQLGHDADNVRYDSINRMVYAGYGDGGIAIIDATTFKIIARIKLSGHPESFQLDQSAKRIYVNVPSQQQVEIIDLKKNKVISTWKIDKVGANFSMELDEVHSRLFIACRHPSKLIVLDINNGKTVSSVDIDSDADDVFYNVQTKEIYLSCGTGYIHIIKQKGANSYTPNGKVFTSFGARTSLFIPQLNQLIIAAPAQQSRTAELLVYQTK